jgi:hypothetical protein
MWCWRCSRVPAVGTFVVSDQSSSWGPPDLQCLVSQTYSWSPAHQQKTNSSQRLYYLDFRAWGWTKPWDPVLNTNRGQGFRLLAPQARSQNFFRCPGFLWHAQNFEKRKFQCWSCHVSMLRGRNLMFDYNSPARRHVRGPFPTVAVARDWQHHPTHK